MIRLPTPEDTHAFGTRIGQLLGRGDVVALYGELGAGKTTLSRGILTGLGFEGEVASPTFPIVQPYEPPAVRLPLWHVDLYRLEHSDEVQELALDEALSEAALLIEWPERLGGFLWPQTLRLRLTPVEGGERALTATVPAAWEGRWPR